MNETLCKRKNITILSVSNLDLCIESLTSERNDIVKSLEYYFTNNSTFKTASVNWIEFFNPSMFIFIKTYSPKRSMLNNVKPQAQWFSDP